MRDKNTTIQASAYNHIEENDPLLKSKGDGVSFVPSTKWDYLVFMSIGLGSSWVLLSTVFYELPWFETTQPEGIELAAWFGISGAFAMFTGLVINRYGGKRSQGAKAALFISIFHIAVVVLIAFTWNVTV